jgi:hypothetical protein
VAASLALYFASIVTLAIALPPNTYLPTTTGAAERFNLNINALSYLWPDQLTDGVPKNCLCDVGLQNKFLKHTVPNCDLLAFGIRSFCSLCRIGGGQ